jgi:hypothetical protein
MLSSEMLRRVPLIRTDDSEELSASNIRVTIDELATTLAVTSNCHVAMKYYSHPYDGGAKLLRNISSYKSHIV